MTLLLLLKFIFAILIVVLQSSTSNAKAQDCVMTHWSDWNGCMVGCGGGIKQRERQVLKPPSGGGKSCGKLRQTHVCRNNRSRCRNIEIAQILPAYFNRKRNEPDRYKRPNVLKKMALRRNSYCIHYRIKSVAWYCRDAFPYHELKIGSVVCAECHDTAMNDRGLCQGATTGMISRWRATEGPSCHGSWESDGDVIRNCRCGEIDGDDFIFV